MKFDWNDINKPFYRSKETPKCKCICDTPILALRNVHQDKRKIDLTLLKDNDGYGIVIFDHNVAIAVFDIKYCPKCGRKLEV